MIRRRFRRRSQRCANTYGHTLGGGTIFFPPGAYILTQPQVPSTAAIFPIPCSDLHFQGGNGTNLVVGRSAIQSTAADAINR